jgi:hypothetical protein
MSRWALSLLAGVGWVVKRKEGRRRIGKGVKQEHKPRPSRHKRKRARVRTYLRQGKAQQSSPKGDQRQINPLKPGLAIESQA